MKYIIGLLMVAALFTSCSKDNSTDNDVNYLVFGSYYGFCVGNCANFYQIKNGKLYADTMDRFTGTTKFKTQPLSGQKYTIAKSLIDSLPGYLTNRTDTTYGCPDCADQGGIYIEILKNGEKKHWNIDNYENGLPVEVKIYARQVKRVLQQLK